MRWKRFGAVVLAVFVLGWIFTDGAFAANEFKELSSAWYVGPSPGSQLAEGTSKALTMTATGTQSLSATVFGGAFKLSMSGINCTNCKIVNVGTSAKIEGTLVFTGVTVTEPAGCGVASTITTKPVTGLVGSNTAAALVTLKFTPMSGTTFALIEITGASCPISGLYTLSGTIFAQGANKREVFATNQELTMSKAIQESAGTATSLSFGGGAATMTGAIKNTLAPKREFAVSYSKSAGATGQYVESVGTWYTGASPGRKLPEGTTQAITTEAPAKLTLEGSVEGKALALTATGLGCKSCAIKNVGTSALMEGNLEFTGVGLSEPEPTNCGVATSIETNKLKATVGMKKGSGTVATIKFVPETGTLLATVEITGAKCSIAGLRKITGTIYGEASNATAVFSKSQPIKLSPAIQESAGSGTSLKLSENEAGFTGTFDVNSEVEFAAKEAAPKNEFEESPSAWYTGSSPGVKLAEGAIKGVSTEAGTKLNLESTVSGKTLDLTATGVECIGCLIKNVGTKAAAAGFLKFTGVGLSEPEPAVCGVASALVTKELNATVGMLKGSATVATIKFAPETGTTIATVEITGAKCSIAGTYNLTGVFYAEASNATGLFGKSQPLKLSKAIQEEAGTPTSMKLGEGNAFLAGTVNLNAEGEFAPKEK